MSLFLIGMRGAGKTAAGALAAARLGVPFLDADVEIEARAGRSISDLFALQGERGLRRLEREVLLELLPRSNQLVATGGGCVVDAEVRGALRRFGRVIWLAAPAPVLAMRIRGSNRPSLTGVDPADEVAGVLTGRLPLYYACADHIIPTEDRSPEEVASVIEQLWALLPHHQLR